MSSAADATAPRVPDAIEKLAKALSSAFKASRLYPRGGDIPHDAALEAVHALDDALRVDPELSLEVTKDGLLYEGAAVLPASESFAAFAREFYARQVAAVLFHPGLSPHEVEGFVAALATPPSDVANQGGFEAVLWQAGVTNISVTAVSTRIIDHEPDTEALDQAVEHLGGWPPDPEQIEGLLEGAVAGQKRDQRTLVRVMRDPRLVADFLHDSLAKTRGVQGFVDIVARIGALARAVQSELPGDQESLLSSLAEAVSDLDPQTRSRLMKTRLLAEARRDESIASIVRQIGEDGALDSVLFSFDETPASLAGISRALRNLALINVTATKEQLFSDAAERMREAGASDAFVGAVRERAAQKRLSVAERSRSAEIQPVETVLKLLTMAPTGRAALVHDADLEPVREEAARGTTDGDVIATLVTLATIERRPDQFASVMSLLEDGIGLLIDEHEFEVAADCADALLTAADADDVGEAQRNRIRRVLDALGAPESARKITEALRLFRSDTPEYAACRRLLSLLGGGTIEGLLDVLAEEPDMAARKAVVDLISGMADGYIPELGKRIRDSRWYFVRNVVAILGATRSQAALDYLRPTLRHEDARVRRETIRSLSMIRASASDSLLIAALGDDDAQNVQLAARYLGSLVCRAAVPVLIDVAHGEGSGNRDHGPRIEAIEALGRISDPATVPVLQKLARRRFLFGGRDKDVRLAAERALVTFGKRASRTGAAQ